MNCIICDDKRPVFGQGAQGREILLMSVVTVWCCDKCIEALVFIACDKAFRKRCEEKVIE